MKLEPPLSNLIARCQTICVAECCGIDAYDFSPLHIASYLTMWRGAPDESDLAAVRCQIESLKLNYGSQGTSAHGATIEEMNQVFTGEQIDQLADELEANLRVALTLIQRSESQRYKRAEQGGGEAS